MHPRTGADDPSHLSVSVRLREKLASDLPIGNAIQKCNTIILLTYISVGLTPFTCMAKQTNSSITNNDHPCCEAKSQI